MQRKDRIVWLQVSPPFATIFPVGQVVTGQTSGTTGKILKRNLDLGQLVIETQIKTLRVS